MSIKRTFWFSVLLFIAAVALLALTLFGGGVSDAARKGDGSEKVGPHSELSADGESIGVIGNTS